MPTTTETRLAAYLAAEAAILTGQEARSHTGRSLKLPDLAVVQAEIKRLQLQVAREQAAAASGSGLNYALANLSGGTGQ